MDGQGMHAWLRAFGLPLRATPSYEETCRNGKIEHVEITARIHAYIPI